MRKLQKNGKDREKNKSGSKIYLKQEKERRKANQIRKITAKEVKKQNQSKRIKAKESEQKNQRNRIKETKSEKKKETGMPETLSEIVRSTEEAALLLRRVSDLLRENPETEDPEAQSLKEKTVHDLLREAVCRKLMIDPDEADTDEFRKLAILSIRRSSTAKGLSDSAVNNQVEKYDCHQTNLVTQKKVLLMLYMEKVLRVEIPDDEASEIVTVRQFAEYLCRHAAAIH